MLRKINSDKDRAVNKLLYVSHLVGEKILTPRLINLADSGELSDEDILEELKRLNETRYLKQVKQQVKRFGRNNNYVFIGEFAR